VDYRNSFCFFRIDDFVYEVDDIIFIMADEHINYAPVEESVIRTSLDVPVNVNQGSTLAPKDKLRIRSSETHIFKSQVTDKYQGVIIVPGFGHTVAKIGDNFLTHGKEIAAQMELTTAVVAPDVRDSENMAVWSYLPGEVDAYKDALRHLGVPVHTVAFSRSGSAILNEATIEADRGQLLSLTLVAPLLRQRIMELFRKAGSSIESIGTESGERLEIGRRKTRVLTEVDNPTLETLDNEKQLLRKCVEQLSKKGVKITILGSKDDPLVTGEFIQEFADAAGLSIQWVDAGGTEIESIHDFASPQMREAIVSQIKKSLISSEHTFSHYERLPDTIDQIAS
jgi:hypothetical protein